LLSAGGDGSVRLWDTMAVGPFGEVATSTKSSEDTPASMTTTKKKTTEPTPTTSSASDDVPDMSVPGLRPENPPYSSGAALAVYRGHTPSSPVWSVAFSPSGYYFATAGADATARLWTTDRPVPVRLFTGHTANNVNCVGWHPNCNYVITGSDDKTCRLWDIQTGRTVRLLSGCRAGIHAVGVSPGGRYAVGSDYSGVVHMWDLGNGKKVTEFRPPQSENIMSCGNPLVHSMSFSACGTALATGGDDCCIRIWDIRSEALDRAPVIETPAKSFPTKKSLLMDLQFTRRNLLLSVGKFVTPVPLSSKATPNN
jgi:transcription initiation factor TFIID subunit 5